MNKNVNPYFDLRQELHIYKYVCREKMNCKERKELKKNNKEHMYTTYAQWREYVEKKFGSYSKKELEEFSRYLNHRIRTNEPGKEYWNILISALMACVITVIMNGINEIISGQKMPSLLANSIYVCWGVSIVSITWFFTLKLSLGILWGENTNKNFYIDYKEIIDEMKK